MAIDESGLPDPRADGGAVLPLILKMPEFVDVVAHVADVVTPLAMFRMPSESWA